MLRHFLHEIKIRIAQDEPFRASCFEVDLDPRMRALPFTVQYDAVAELAVSDALAQSYAEFRTRPRCARGVTGTPESAGHRPGHLDLRPYFFNKLGRYFGDES